MHGVVGLELLLSCTLFVLSEKAGSSASGSSVEYCQLETFHPQCLKNEVVAIEAATYGRHRVGKCITDKESSFARDLEYFGCHANVVRQMHARCSGRRQCEVRIPDAELEQTRTCLPGLQMFLEVTYRCLEIVEAERSCHVLVTPRRLHMTGIQPEAGRIHCGTKASPWLLEAPSGQRIKLGLLDFTQTTTKVSPVSTVDLPTTAGGGADNAQRRTIGVNCTHQRTRKVGYIIDKSAGTKNVSICSGDGHEAPSHDLYLSHSNVVELVLASAEELTNNGPRVIISFEAVGCTNLVPPEDAWVKREDDKITIGCYTSRQTWQLRCQDGRWLGVVSNCEADLNLSKPVEVAFQKTTDGVLANYNVATVVAIGFTGLAACLTIVCTGVVCLHRFYASFPSKTSKKPGVSDCHFERIGGNAA